MLCSRRLPRWASIAYSPCRACSLSLSRLNPPLYPPNFSFRAPAFSTPSLRRCPPMNFVRQTSVCRGARLLDGIRVYNYACLISHRLQQQDNTISIRRRSLEYGRKPLKRSMGYSHLIARAILWLNLDQMPLLLGLNEGDD